MNRMNHPRVPVPVRESGPELILVLLVVLLHVFCKHCHTLVIISFVLDGIEEIMLILAWFTIRTEFGVYSDEAKSLDLVSPKMLVQRES